MQKYVKKSDVMELLTLPHDILADHIYELPGIYIDDELEGILARITAQIKPDKELYEGDDVLVKKPWEGMLMDGYQGAYCQCGHALYIKTPMIKKFHPIKCPICEHVVNLFCGRYGSTLSMSEVRQYVPSIGEFGD